MDRTQRELEQREKYAAMSRPRKVGMILLAAAAATAAALLAGYLVSGEVRWPMAIVCGIGVVVAFAVKYRDTW